MTKNLNFSTKDAFHQFALDNWLASVNCGDLERAIAFDQLHYNELVKKFEDVAYWDRWQEDTLQTRQELTQQYESRVPASLPISSQGNRFLIVHHNYSGLAHETQLARNMAWLRTNDVSINVDIVYLFGSPETKSDACSIYGLGSKNIHYLQANSYQNAGAKLTILAGQTKAKGIIYPTIFSMAFWLSLFVPHGNQKFVQMKYYPLHAGRINGWAGGYRSTGQFYEINGCKFEQLPILDLQLAKQIFPPLYKEADVLTIGSISRPEKIGNVDYNRFILKLLQTHPNLNYLYTGRIESTSVLPEPIRKHPRCRSLGWVNPIESISEFSIYLEPFPWGGGEMTLLALEAGLPYLTLETQENVRFGIYGFLRVASEGKDPILQTSFCRSPSELLNRVNLLIKNPDLRHDLGQAWRQAITSYSPPSIEGWRSLFNE